MRKSGGKASIIVIINSLERSWAIEKRQLGYRRHCGMCTGKT